MPPRKISLIVWGCIVFVTLFALPLLLNLFKNHSVSLGDFEGPAIALVLTILMFKHSRLARFVAVLLCLFYAMIFGPELPLAQSRSESGFSFGILLGWVAVALLLWLAWLFSSSRSARAWFPKP